MRSIKERLIEIRMFLDLSVYSDEKNSTTHVEYFDSSRTRLPINGTMELELIRANCRNKSNSMKD